MLREFAVEVIHPTNDGDTIYSLLANRAMRDPQGVIAQWQDDDTRQWHDVTASEMLLKVRATAKGLIALGVERGSKVVIYSPTCYEWGVTDFACACIGAVSIPIYETDSAIQAAEIISEVKPVIAFAGDDEHAQCLERVRQDNKRMSLKTIFNFKAAGIDAVIDFGKSISDDELNRSIGQVKADDLATIVYTSGSTGKPKGAMLSNRNFTHIVYAAYDVLNDMLYKPSRLLLFLPLAHCFARYIQYVAIGSHGVIGYVPNAKHLLADLRSFKPTYLLGVPRVFEKVYNAASQKAGAGIRGRIFAKAVQHFIEWSKDEVEGRAHSIYAKLQHDFYMKTVGSSIRSALGPNLSWLACGGAPINAELAHFFNGLDGITFIQGYGMTETAAPCVVNFEHANQVGSVGRPGPGITIRIADDGEVLVKGPNVFIGYYDKPDLTSDVIDEDGWLHSGDLGEIDDEGFLSITGRKKDIIITAGGKNISPAPLESIISKCPLVSHAVVVGDGKPFVSALIEIEPDMVRSWLKSQGMDENLSMSAVAENDAIRSVVQQFIDQANSTVSRAESIRKFIILDEEFSQDAGTLTPSMKVVRPKVLKRYCDLIESQLYAPKPNSRPLPATVKILDKTTETVKQAQETVKQAQEAVTPRVKQAIDQAATHLKRFGEDLPTQINVKDQHTEYADKNNNSNDKE
ncbi:long-chain-fatty acid CoA ligase [Gardnerella vaginalis 1400E]|uniref:Acyl-CoA synthetase n=1 Tax=Gardnerella vaginalis 1400E TaxID=698956 RepID=I4LSH2_GARVA|nr:AMP-dependent synthetase/ligase [Gardnerella vaginalis]EIK79912.1 long-chain-fatty acid CoA ligase [Gardnerella vaginalis 1400E]